VSNVRAGGVAEGGSTITQQLARNLFPEWLPYQDRSMRRKVMEARVARQLERSFSKDKILELYLNHIYLGEGAYGIEAASQAYFGKPAAELTSRRPR
jgi:penicillin-binding protein 1A